MCPGLACNQLICTSENISLQDVLLHTRFQPTGCVARNVFQRVQDTNTHLWYPVCLQQSFDFYVENYPDGPGAVLGLLTYQRIMALQLDHIYTAWWFYALLGLLAASLTACTITRQWPVVKVRDEIPYAQHALRFQSRLSMQHGCHNRVIANTTLQCKSHFHETLPVGLNACVATLHTFNLPPYQPQPMPHRSPSAGASRSVPRPWPS